MHVVLVKNILILVTLLAAILILVIFDIGHKTVQAASKPTFPECPQPVTIRIEVCSVISCWQLSQVLSQGRTEIKMKATEELQKLHLSTRCDTKMIIMVWACDAKGKCLRKKKHTIYEGGVNKTRMTSREEIACPTENDMLIYGINPEMATDRERW